MELFPFGMVFSNELLLNRAGRSLQKVAGPLGVGEKITEKFSVILPDHESLNIEWIRRVAGTTFAVLLHRNSDVRLRGGFYQLAADNYAFLGSIWMTDPADLGRYQLTMRDFAVMDPMLDMLMVLQFNRSALDDVKLAASRLKQRHDELKRVNGELQSSREKLNLLSESFDNLCLVGLGADGRVEYWGDAAERLFGYSEARALGMHVSQLVQPRHAEADALLTIDTDSFSGDWVAQATRSDGERFHAAIACKQVTSAESNGYSMIVRDVTEDERKQKELAHLRKMETIGEVAGGIAHNLNNMMGIIIGNLDVLDEVLQHNDDFTAETLRLAKQAAAEASEITRSLLQYARKAPSLQRTCDINELVLGMTSLLKGILASHGRFELEIFPGRASVTVDVQAFKQSVINLLLNARDATKPQDADIRLRTNIRTTEEHKLAVLEVSDNGCGIAADIINRVTEPFFTTKEPGRGTGLGLSSVKGFVEESGGFIEIESSEGCGASLRLCLPCAH